MAFAIINQFEIIELQWCGIINE